MTLTDAQLAEIETRRDSFQRDSIVIATSMDTPEDAQIAADYDALIAALRASRERERRLQSGKGTPMTNPNVTAAVLARGLCPSPDHKDADGNYEHEGYSDIPCICPETAAALTAYAAEHRREGCPCYWAESPCNKYCPCKTPGYSHACLRCARHGSDEQRKARANIIQQEAIERDAALAKVEDAESCTTCDGQPHASGSICICGGSGRRSDETLNLRQLAQATQGQLDTAKERVRVLEAALREAREGLVRGPVDLAAMLDSVDAALDAKAAAAPCPYKDECDRKGEHVAPNCPSAAADPHPFDYDNEEASDAR